MRKKRRENETSSQPSTKPYRRRFGDRSDGRRLRKLPPISMMSPYLMKTRNASAAYYSDSVEISKMEEYINEKRAQGLTNFGAMHVFIASYVRAASQRPALNRFVNGRKIFSRHNIEVNLTIKKDMTLESPDTVIKSIFPPGSTAEDVYQIIDKTISKEKENMSLDSSFDNTAKFISKIPRFLLRFTIWLLEYLDFYGLLPKSLLNVSPFHGSAYFTSMGSLGIPPVYHHLYDFGNVPLFLSFGAKYKKTEISNDGSPVLRKYIDYRIVVDERICDGFYLASALKLAKRHLKNPYLLSKPPETIVEDIQ